MILAVAVKSHTVGIAVAVSAAGVALALVAGALLSSPAVASHSAESATTFGIGQVTSSTTSTIGQLSSADQSDSGSLLDASSASDASILSSGVNYDVMVGVYQIEAQREAERLAEEEARRAEEQAHVDQAMSNIAAWESVVAGDSGKDAIEGLSPVDWTVGRDAFISEWAERIDAYLARTTLAGYGEVFATAAWENGVDPRWSPAISNTESGNGFNCFLPHNAWGWGNSSWSSWTQAINEHVAGLAKGYGYSITYSFAAKYCPPNTEHWFNNTISQMERI